VPNDDDDDDDDDDDHDSHDTGTIPSWGPLHAGHVRKTEI
jgi:hypothetical protein